MPDLARSPRAVLVATLTTGLLAIQYLASDAIAWQIQKRTFDVGPLGDGFFTTVVLHAFDPFYGNVFRSQVRVAEDVAPMVVGLLVACVVAWLGIVVVSRKGILAAFVGAWLAVILGSWAASMASAFVWIQTTEVPEDGPYVTQILAGAFDHGLHWGFVFGWFPALVAALLASVLHKRQVTPVEPTKPTEHTGPTEHPWLTKHQGPTEDTGSQPKMM